LRHSGWLPIRSARAVSEVPAQARDELIANF
jgi:hypothetical protein